MTGPATPSGTPPAPRGARVGRAVRSSSRLVTERVRIAFSSRGRGFFNLAATQAGAAGGDTLVAMALAGTLFFTVPSTEARENVLLYLLLTLAPFTVLGPLLGRVYERFPGAYRGGLVMASALRAAVALLLVPFLHTVFLFPLAFTLLVLSRLHGISRSSVMPLVLADSDELVAANAHLARLGVFGSVLVAPVGALSVWLELPALALLVAAGVYAWSAMAARFLPSLRPAESAPAAAPRPRSRAVANPRPVRLARFATAGVRFINGFLLLLVAFAFRDADAGLLDFGFLLAAGGFGFLLAAVVTPVLARRVAEEPMVVAGLAVEAGAAFIAALAFSLPAAATLALAAGFAWGTAKFGFDGLLQATVPIEARGRAFTNSESMFQIAWVLGAVIPVGPVIPIEVGLAVAGVAALIIQVVYVSTLIPLVNERRRGEQETRPDRPGKDVLDLF